MKVVLVQCKKLKQYQKEESHFQTYAEMSLVKISKSVFVDMAKCSQKIGKHKQVQIIL